MLEFVGFKTHDLITLYVLDGTNSYGFKQNHVDKAEDGQDANCLVKFGVQSDNMYFFDGEDMSFPFKSYPMQELNVRTLGLAETFSKIGGFWSSISGVSFLLLNYFLFRYF